VPNSHWSAETKSLSSAYVDKQSETWKKNDKDGFKLLINC